MYEHEYRPLLLIIVIELGCFFSLWGLFFGRHITFFFRSKLDSGREKRLSTFLMHELQSTQSVQIKAMPRMTFRELLLGLERFQSRFAQERWMEIKQVLTEQFLLPKARKYVKSLFWKRRAFAARVFVLVSKKEDEESMLALMKDSHEVTQIYVASALIAIESKKGVQKILESMQRYKGYRYYLFQDVLQKCSNELLEWILELSVKPSFQEVGLAVLAKRSLGRSIPFLQGVLQGKDEKKQLLAIELLVNNPTSYAESMLIEFTQHGDVKIRKKAIWGLGKLGKKEGIHALKQVFEKDLKMSMRVEAARALYCLGQLEGMADNPIKSYVVQFER